MEKKERCDIRLINAGGGLVQNGFGEYLLILKNGKWDLPKGAQNEGEALSATALREVQEECGITSIVLGRFIACTWHSYWVEANSYSPQHCPLLCFKHTFWYYMYVEGRPQAHPQTQEGIEQCRWCTPEDVAVLLGESYPSIRWLFREIVRQ